MPKVAVVILNFNGQPYLEKFLPSVIKNAQNEAEIWIADNGSTDNSLEFLHTHFKGIRTIQLAKNHGFAEGYNRALAQITADYYILLNSDVATPEGWIRPIIKQMENDPQIAAAQPKILAQAQPTHFEHAGAAGGWMDNLGYPFCRGRILFNCEADTGQYNTPQEIFWASGAAMFVRAELYHAAGGLDGDFFAHMEEIDLCWRLKRLGYKIVVCPQSKVLHVGGGTLQVENPRKTYLNFRNSLLTLLKNETWQRLLWLIPIRLILDGVAAARFLFKGQLRHIWAILKAHLHFYLRFAKTLKKRHSIQKIIENQAIGPPNRSGIFGGSIIWNFFIRQKKTFDELF